MLNPTNFTFYRVFIPKDLFSNILFGLLKLKKGSHLIKDATIPHGNGENYVPAWIKYSQLNRNNGTEAQYSFTILETDLLSLYKSLYYQLDDTEEVT